MSADVQNLAVRDPGLYVGVGAAVGAVPAVVLVTPALAPDEGVVRVPAVEPVVPLLADQEDKVCNEVLRDKVAHVSFLTEKLTAEFADFNFARRNLRRLRLRIMCALAIVCGAVFQGKLLAAAGISRQNFAAKCWARLIARLTMR